MSEKRKIRKVPFFLDVEFADSIPHDKIQEVAENIALALKQAVDHGSGLSPEADNNGFDGTITNKVRIMCKDVVLIQEDYTKLDGERHITIERL